MSASWSTGLLILVFSSQILCNHNDPPVVVSKNLPNHPKNRDPFHHSGNDDNAIAGSKPSSSSRVNPPVPSGIPNDQYLGSNVTLTQHQAPHQVPYLRVSKLQCPATAVLNFARVGLRRIGDAFIESSETKELYLDGNDIAEISSTAFSSLDRLEVLSLSSNNIPTDKLLWFAKHYMLRKLVLDDNRYNDTSSVHKIFQSLPKLEELSLKRNGISRFAVNLNNFAPRLKELQLSGNSIEELDFLDDLPTTLSHLHLDDNQIVKVRSVALQNLVELSVSGNKIEELCLERCSDSFLSLKGMRRLQRLNASRNGIESVADDAFDDANDLISLDLSGNKIKSLSVDAFKPSSRLEELFLSSNLFASVPYICSLHYLKQLDLSNNNIGVVTKDNLCGESNLQLHALLLNGNHITEVDSDIYTQLKYLKKLDLSNNLIMHLPVHLIHKARSLRTLLLKDNRIDNIDELFGTHSNSLQDLHLQGNPISAVKYSVRSDTVVHLKDVPRETKEEPEDLTSNDIDKDYSSDLFSL